MKKYLLIIICVVILKYLGLGQLTQFPQVYYNGQGSGGANLLIHQSNSYSSSQISLLSTTSKIGAESLSTNASDPYFYNWIKVCLPSTSSTNNNPNYGYIASNEFYARINETNNYAIVNTVTTPLGIRTCPGCTTQYVTLGGQNIFFGRNSILALTTGINTQGWYEVYLTAGCSQTTGWVNGIYLTLPVVQNYFNVGGRICTNASDCNYLGSVNAAIVNIEGLSSIYSSAGSFEYKLPINWSGSISCTHPNYSTSTATFINPYTASNHNYEENFILSNSSCSYSISPANNSNVPVSGGSGYNINVIAGSECNWITSTNGSTWITIYAGNNGIGNGVCTYSVSNNPNLNSRSGTILIAGQSFNITQAGTLSNCLYSISPSSNTSIPSIGGIGYSISVAASSGCNWTASASGYPWITITSGNNGTGNGGCIYSVSNNPNTNNRPGFITIADQSFSVLQEGTIPTYTISGYLKDVSINFSTGTLANSVTSGVVNLYSSTGTLLNTINVGSNGYFEFNNLANISYDMKAHKSGAAFTSNISVNNITPQSNLVLKVPYTLLNQAKQLATDLEHKQFDASVFWGIINFQYSASAYNESQIKALLTNRQTINSNNDNNIEGIGRLYIAQKALKEFSNDGLIMTGEFSNSLVEVAASVFDIIMIQKKIEKLALGTWYESYANIIVRNLSALSLRMIQRFVDISLNSIQNERFRTVMKAKLNGFFDLLRANAANSSPGEKTKEIIENEVKNLLASLISVPIFEELFVNYFTQQNVSISYANANSNNFSGTFSNTFNNIVSQANSNSSVSIVHQETNSTNIDIQTIKNNSDIAQYYVKIGTSLTNVLGSNSISYILSLVINELGSAFNAGFNMGTNFYCIYLAYGQILNIDDELLASTYSSFQRNLDLLPAITTSYSNPDITNSVNYYNSILNQIAIKVSNNERDSALILMQNIQNIGDTMEVKIQDNINYINLAGLYATSSISNFDSINSHTLDFLNKTIYKRQGLYCNFLSYIIDSTNSKFKDSILNLYPGVINSNNALISHLDFVNNSLNVISIPPHIYITGHNEAKTMAITNTYPITIFYKNYTALPIGGLYCKLNTSGGFGIANDSIYIGSLNPGISDSITFNITAPAYDTLSNITINFADSNQNADAIGIALSSAHIPDIPVLGSYSSSYVCLGDSIKLFCDSVYNANYFWNGPNNFISHLQNPVIQNSDYTNAGTYSCYIKVNDLQSPAATRYVTIATDIHRTLRSGNWNNPSIWSCNQVPALNDSVVIVSGHNIIINNSSHIRKLFIENNSSIYLNDNSVEFTIGDESVKNSAVICNGTLGINKGGFKIHGNLTLTNSSIFNMSGGKLIIDGNTGQLSSSIPDGQHLFNIYSTAGNFNFSGGELQFTNPPFGANSQTINCPYNFSPATTVIFGNGTSTIASNNSNGFGGNLMPYQIGKLIFDPVISQNNRVFKNLKPLIVRTKCEVRSGNIIQGSLLQILDSLSLIDYDGNNYPVVDIYNQNWSAKNLDLIHYRNGDPIPHVQDSLIWSNLTTGAWCYYNNDSSNGSVYGRLYNWYAVNDPRGLAPPGWHIPNDAECTTLFDYLGGELIAGGSMKEMGTTHWVSPNTEATNSSGFTGLPGGLRLFDDGSFNVIGIFGNWWSSSESDDTHGMCFYNYNAGGGVGWGGRNKNNGFSVRCIKDEPNNIFTDTRDGQVYPYKQIGSQVWMTKNLNFNAVGSWCYDNILGNGDIYGRLYDWNTALTVAPPGWHLPSDEEWNTLITYLGSETVAGGKMKETGTTHWITPNTDATNSSGFTGLPGGSLFYGDGSFNVMGLYGNWWSSTEFDPTHGWSFYITNSSGVSTRVSLNKLDGFSIRCIKD